MSDDPYFGEGTTPRQVAEAVRKALDERHTARDRHPTVAQRERFFRELAEHLERARGE